MKLVMAFLIGVIVTLAVLTGFGWGPPKVATGENIERSPVENSVGQAVPVQDAGGPAEQGETEEKLLEATVSNVDGVIAPSTIADPVQPDSMTDSSVARQTATSRLDEYPPEIAFMIENRIDPELQARYEADAREESWATYMEGQIKAYLAQKPALSQFYFSLIDCRTTVCQIHALGYGADALTQWNVATADLVSQPWMEFNNMSMDRHNPEPDILGIVVVLTKSPN